MVIVKLKIRFRPRLSLAFSKLGATPSHNSGHTATLRSAKIQQSRTSYVRKTLSEMLCLRKTKRMGEKNLKTEKVFNMTMEKVVANNHSKKRDVQMGETPL